MSRKARSARGDVVDFDVLAIKDQLATRPVPVGVDQRRRFIDEKDGIKTRQQIPVAPVPAALAMAVEAVAIQETAPVVPQEASEAEATEE
jgi:hypothetical protein